MTPTELAARIAEEIFRTIERENGIVKAEIIDAVEKVLAQQKPRETPPPPPSESTLEQRYGQYVICRLHAWPYAPLDGAKEEGAPTPEA